MRNGWIFSTRNAGKPVHSESAYGSTSETTRLCAVFERFQRFKRSWDDKQFWFSPFGSNYLLDKMCWIEEVEMATSADGHKPSQSIFLDFNSQTSGCLMQWSLLPWKWSFRIRTSRREPTSQSRRLTWMSDSFTEDRSPLGSRNTSGWQALLRMFWIILIYFALLCITTMFKNSILDGTKSSYQSIRCLQTFFSKFCMMCAYVSLINLNPYWHSENKKFRNIIHNLQESVMWFLASSRLSTLLNTIGMHIRWEVRLHAQRGWPLA